MPKNTISNISALEILDSRGNPTIMARVLLTDGREARASVPSGASTGRYEALELRDGEANRFKGKGVLRAVNNIKTTLSEGLKGMPIEDLRAIDERMNELDGTPYKSNIGANATLAVSLAAARLAAKVAGEPLYVFLRSQFGFPDHAPKLPKPMINIINGGKHSDAGFSVQEYMIMPHAGSFHERIRIASEVFHSLGDVLHKQGFSTLVGDEGGYGPRYTTNEKAFEDIIEATKNTTFQVGADLSMAVDVAATNFYEAKDKTYHWLPENTTRSLDKMVELYKQWVEKYFVRSIEDGLAEDDWSGWKMLTSRVGKQAMIVGDDLFATNPERLTQGISEKVGNAIIIKPNQIGTLSETVDCIKLAQANGYKVIVANRSGETIDHFIADLAVATDAEFIKTGSLCRGERLAKYNRLLEIEMELGEWKPSNA
jgi:enolase